MERTTNRHADAVSKDDSVVLMYPGNQLKGQLRPFDDTLSAFQVVKDEFFKKN